jgi:hypothetical protein
MGFLGWDATAAIANERLGFRAIAAYVAWHRPTLAFVVGLLGGHFFAPPCARPQSLPLCAMLALVCMAVLVWLEYSANAPAWCVPAVPLIAGLIVGCFLWTRRDPLNWRDL